MIGNDHLQRTRNLAHAKTEQRNDMNLTVATNIQFSSGKASSAKTTVDKVEHQRIKCPRNTQSLL